MAAKLLTSGVSVMPQTWRHCLACCFGSTQRRSSTDADDDDDVDAMTNDKRASFDDKLSANQNAADYGSVKQSKEKVNHRRKIKTTSGDASSENDSGIVTSTEPRQRRDSRVKLSSSAEHKKTCGNTGQTKRGHNDAGISR